MSVPLATRRELHALADAHCDAIARALAQIEKLQRRVADLEKATGTKQVIEWPLRGKGAA